MPARTVGKLPWTRVIRSKVGRVHGVHAHRHPVQPGCLERDGKRLQQMAVGGQGQVQRLAAERAQPRQFLHQLHHPAPQKRLAARQPHLGDSQAHKNPDQPQVFVDAQLRILRPHFACAAIHAFVIAAVGDGDAQIVDHAPMAVRQRRVGRHGGRYGREAAAIR